MTRIGDHQRHVDGLLERHAALLAQVMGATLLAVIRGENEDRVVRLTARVQRIEHRSDVPVHVENAVEVVVDVVMPHVPAIHRYPAVIQVAQALVTAHRRRLRFQVVEGSTPLASPSRSMPVLLPKPKGESCSCIRSTPISLASE